MNSLEYIRKTYGVPAKRGARIIYLASDGEDISAVITGAKNGRLRARIENLDGTLQRRPSLFHPTWNITYPAQPSARGDESEL